MRWRNRYYLWMYRGGRPNWLARPQNRLSVLLARIPSRQVALEVPGRRTGRLVSLPLALVTYQDDRYLVGMLGEGTNWVRNVRANEGRAVLRQGRREAVRLEEVDPTLRPPILRRYLAIPPGARPHVPVDRHAPLHEFERIAARYPVFRVVPDTDHAADEAPARRRSRAGR